MDESSMDFFPSSATPLEWDATKISLRPSNTSLSASLCNPYSDPLPACDSGITVTTSTQNPSSPSCLPRSSVTLDEVTEALTLASFLPTTPDPSITIDFAPNSICLKDVNNNQISTFPSSSFTYTTSLPAKPVNPNPSGNTTDTPEEIPIYGIGVYVTDLSSLSLKDSTFYADLRVYVLKYYKTYTAETKDDVLHNALDPANPSSCQFKVGTFLVP